MGFMLIVAVVVSIIHIIGHVLMRKVWHDRYHRLPWFCLTLNIMSIFGLGVCWGSNYTGSIAAAVLQAITVWLMIQVFNIFLLAALLAGRFVYRHCRRLPVDRSRRQFAKGAVLLPCAAVGASAYGAFSEKDATVVRNYDFPVENLGNALEGFSIVQLSDVHLGPFFDLAKLEELLTMTAQQKANVLVITGDLFDNPKDTLQAARLVDSFVDKFPQGIYYCRGNHEHFRGIALVEAALADTRIHNLVNTSQLVLEDSRPLYIAGVDYPMQREQFQLLQDAYTSMAMENIPEGAVKVLLAHHPDFVESAARYNTELVLSGHTHGGQLGFMGVPLVPPVFRYMRGWYHEGNTALYVHCGNGSWFPFRMGCPPEIAVFHLHRK